MFIVLYSDIKGSRPVLYICQQGLFVLLLTVDFHKKNVCISYLKLLNSGLGNIPMLL